MRVLSTLLMMAWGALACSETPAPIPAPDAGVAPADAGPVEPSDAGTTPDASPPGPPASAGVQFVDCLLYTSPSPRDRG